MIGNKRQKIDLINQGVVDKLLNILNDGNQPERVKIESVIVLGSLAKGDEQNVNVILSSGALPTLITGKRTGHHLLIIVHHYASIKVCLRFHTSNRLYTASSELYTVSSELAVFFSECEALKSKMNFVIFDTHCDVDSE